MANSVTHAALPFPVRGARFSMAIPYLDADGDPTDPTTPDTERSIDAAAFADCTEEVTTISGSNGVGYITLTGDEMNGSMIVVAAKAASGPKATLATLYPRVPPVLESGTAQTGAAGSITLAAGAAAYSLIGCIVKTMGGTGGGGGSGSQGNQARVITAYNTSTKVATVVPNWETTPDNTTTYEILLTDMRPPAAASVGLATNNLDSQLAAIDDFLDTEVAAIKAKTDNLPSDPADQSAVEAAITASTAPLATAAALAAVDAVVDAILLDTAEIGVAGAGLTALASQASVDVIDGIVDAILVDTGTTLQAELDGIQADTEDIQARLPATLVGGRMDASVGAMAANVLTAAALAADAVAEIWAGITATAGNWIADHVLRRRTANVEASAEGDTIVGADSLYGMIQQHRAADTTTNPGSLTIFESDGTTELEQLALATDAAADPVTGVG